MSVATDRNKRAVRRGALIKPRMAPSKAMGQRLDDALSKRNGKKHHGS